MINPDIDTNEKQNDTQTNDKGKRDAFERKIDKHIRAIAKVIRPYAEESITMRLVSYLIFGAGVRVW